MLRFRAAVAAACVTLLAACGGSDGPGSPNQNPPPPAPVHTVTVDPNTGLVVIGRSMHLNATTRDENGNVLSGRALTWTSSADGVARVDASGNVTGISTGTATITVTSEGRTAQAGVTVQQAPVGSVRVTPDSNAVRIGDALTFVATTRDDQDNVVTGRAIAWTSSAPAIASIDAATGAVRGVAAGSAIITATSEGKSGTAKIVVTAPLAPVATVTIAPGLDTLEAYDTRQLQATLRDAQGNVLVGRTVTWTSSNPAVATVDAATGLLTGVDRGTVTITATSEGKTGTATRVVIILYRSMTAGTMHACDIASGGIAWCWGLNGNEGRIGGDQLSSTAMSATPVRVPGGLRFTQLASFGRTTCGLTAAGTAYCWGYNGFGTLGAGSNAAQSSTPLPVAGSQSFRTISAGSDHVCAVTVDGAGYCWGNNDWRQLGTGTSTTSSVPTPVSAAFQFATITAGSAFTCGIAFLNGAAYCWGANSIGQTGDGKTINYGNVFVSTPQAVVGGHSFKRIALGSQFACALTQSGQAYCWGSNNGKLGNGPTGYDSSSPVAVAGGLAFRSITAGFGHACGVATDDFIYCWGGNGNGQSGAATGSGITTPARVGSSRAAEVSASGIGTGSGAHSCGISADRLTAWCWGRNDVGQLGNGATTAPTAANPSPTIVAGQKPLPPNP
jgi:alpha-tubulin suppressor-like RCC1 family protein/uncharacterized protein YjdB